MQRVVFYFIYEVSDSFMLCGYQLCLVDPVMLDGFSYFVLVRRLQKVVFKIFGTGFNYAKWWFVFALNRVQKCSVFVARVQKCSLSLFQNSWHWIDL